LLVLLDGSCRDPNVEVLENIRYLDKDRIESALALLALGFESDRCPNTPNRVSDEAVEEEGDSESERKDIGSDRREGAE
jgi:hypothetical protein